MRKTGFWGYAIAVMAGSGIGSLVAISVNHWFWWVGLLAGGLTSYLVVDLPQTIRALGTAWHTVTTWQPNKYYWKQYFWWVIAMANFGIYLLALCVPVYYSGTKNSISMIWFVIGMYVAFLLITFPFLFASNNDRYSNNYHASFKSHSFIRGKWRNAFKWNPLYHAFWIVCAIIGCLLILPRTLREAVRVIGRFLCTFFLLIHSHKRVLAMLDTAIATAISYAIWRTPTAVLGGIGAGLIMSFLDHQLISVHLLHIVPNGNKA